MNISPLQAGGAPLATTVNPPTDQVARDNRVREKIVPLTQSSAATGEKQLSSEEKQLKKPSWDPSEHPTYDQQEDEILKGYQDDIARFIEVLSASNYLDKDSALGYSMHIKLPRELLEQLDRINQNERTKGVVAFKYAQASVPNPPTEYLQVI
ncbi:ATP-dependent Lon protease [Photobacterium leiognathi]|uniref:ATP-dependent Lon protease n=1 Tax=Photobacterium leiognathi TaxID=553611 RepID=UPI001EDD20AE|nr:ATP-dependent Lon protease [Photobacterium leiognathi]MCG3885238.1 ATP-dependent Lon protease [Photobacterium leiognathi]